MQTLIEPDRLSARAASCMTRPLDRIALGDLCSFGDNSNGVKKVVLWGDRHALVLLPAFEALAQANHVQLMFAGRSACRPLRIGAERLSNVANAPCTAFDEAMQSAISRIHPDVTILAGFWESAPERLPESNARDTPESTEWDWGQGDPGAEHAGSRVCVVLDVPELRYPVPYALAMARRRGLDAAFVFVGRSEIVSRYANFEDAARALESRGKIAVADPKDALCPGSRCEVESDGRSLYRDQSHLSRVGAMEVMNSLQTCLR